MAFDKEELKQLGNLFDRQHKLIVGETRELVEGTRSSIMTDIRSLLRPIIDDIAEIKQKIDQLYKMVNDDLGVAYKEIDVLKRQVTKLERRITVLEKR